MRLKVIKCTLSLITLDSPLQPTLTGQTPRGSGNRGWRPGGLPGAVSLHIQGEEESRVEDKRWMDDEGRAGRNTTTREKIGMYDKRRAGRNAIRNGKN